MTTCARNVAPREDDPSPPFRIAYIPCAQPAEVDVHSRGVTSTFCRVHAVEAEREGFAVDWPEDEEPAS